MKNLCSPEIGRYRISHPAGDIPDELRGYAGAFVVPFRSKVSGAYPVERSVLLRVIASRGGGPASLGGDDPLARWDHVSVSLPDRCPMWSEMCFIKDLFFKPDEPAMQLHPVKDYVNNHPYCLHLWRPLDATIPLPPYLLVGLPELNVA